VAVPARPRCPAEPVPVLVTIILDFRSATSRPKSSCERRCRRV
jgi:hypothetical protein